MAKIDNVNLEALEAEFGDEAFDRFSAIAKLGGFGTPTRDHTGGLDAAYKGGLDIKGLREAGTVDEDVIREIERLATVKSAKPEDVTSAPADGSLAAKKNNTKEK